jgi:hypothetical protein
MATYNALVTTDLAEKGLAVFNNGNTKKKPRRHDETGQRVF